MEKLNDYKKNIVTIDFEDSEWISLDDLSLQFPKENWSLYINNGYKKMKEISEREEKDKQEKDKELNNKNIS